MGLLRRGAVRSGLPTVAFGQEQVAEKEESEKLHRELLKTQGDMAHLRGQLDSMNQFFAAERAALRQSAREREAEIEKDKLTVQEKLFDCEKRFGQVEARCHQLMLGKSEVLCAVLLHLHVTCF